MFGHCQTNLIKQHPRSPDDADQAFEGLNSSKTIPKDVFVTLVVAYLVVNIKYIVIRAFK